MKKNEAIKRSIDIDLELDEKGYLCKHCKARVNDDLKLMEGEKGCTFCRYLKDF